MDMATKHGRPWPRLALAAALVAMTGAFGTASGQDLDGDLQKARSEIAKAKKEIQRADVEVRRTDSLMREEGARAAQAEERQAKDRERRDKEIATLQDRFKEAQAKIDAERSSVARNQNALDEIKSRETHLAKVLAGYCDSLEARVNAQLPWENQARLDRIRALKKDLEAGSATAEEGLSRLGAILKEEVKAGDEIALFNKAITRKGGEAINAQVLRLGNQWLVYMDEEARNYGVMERQGGKWDWREELSFAEKNRVREAIEVKGAKRPPQLVVLDLGIAAGETQAAKPPAQSSALPSSAQPAAIPAAIPAAAARKGGAK